MLSRDMGPFDAQGMRAACRYALPTQQAFSGVDDSIVDRPVWAFARAAMTFYAIIVRVDAKQGKVR